MFSKLGVQLFTVRDLIGDAVSMENVFKNLTELGYTQAQTAGHESSEMARMAKKCGISIVGTHYDFDKIKNESDDTIRLHEQLETTNVGLGAMPWWAHETQDTLFKFIDEIGDSALYEFKFNQEQSYLLVFKIEYIEFS